MDNNTPVANNRREDPRDSIQHSIQRWLRIHAEQQGFESLVVADDEGILVAASDYGEEAELLAALAPLSFERPGDVGEPQLVTAPVQMLGSRYYLCGRARLQRAQMQPALAGVTRILAA